MLELNEDSQKKLLESIEIIRNKRKQTLVRDTSNLDLKMPSQMAPLEYDHRGHQKIFNENRIQAVTEAKDRREKLETVSLKLKILSANRRTIKAVLLKKLSAVKHAIYIKKKRAATFIILIHLVKATLVIEDKYSQQRIIWLQN